MLFIGNKFPVVSQLLSSFFVNFGGVGTSNSLIMPCRHCIALGLVGRYHVERRGCLYDVERNNMY